MMDYTALIVDDETALSRNIAQYLARHGYHTQTAETAEDALRELADCKPNVILLDFNLPGMNGLEFLARTRASDPEVKVIMCTGHGSEQVAVDAMKAGAYDYLIKPVALGQLKLVVDKAVNADRRNNEFPYSRERENSINGKAKLLGDSVPMKKLRATIERLIEAEQRLGGEALPAVLITGETGTGKELVARALHFDGSRRGCPFVEVNCSAIPGPLLEAELFGYEKGAFTDAKARKLGLIESAEGGTLFFDEIGEMDLSLQSKLLKFLEDKTVRRLGSVLDHHANVRIIAATNRNLEQRVRAGAFRADLMFRLRIIEIETPTLKGRQEDVPMLATHYLDLLGKRYGKSQLTFSAAALELLCKHSWPGNVRELRNVIEQGVILCSGNVIDTNHVRLSSPIEFDEEPHVRHSDDLNNKAPLGPMNLSDIERKTLLDALTQTAWNVTKAARVLGVSRDTLRYRIEKHRLRVPS